MQYEKQLSGNCILSGEINKNQINLGKDKQFFNECIMNEDNDDGVKLKCFGRMSRAGAFAEENKNEDDDSGTQKIKNINTNDKNHMLFVYKLLLGIGVKMQKHKM